MSSEIYFRPPWTCGKYNAEKHVAIMFNLLSRENFFYEEESAEVIGCVLAAGHNGKVVVEEVSKKCNIVPKSIIKFFDELCTMGILSNTEITEEVIANYRNECKGMDSPQTIGAHSEELSNDGVQSAYQAYADSVRDCVSLVDVMFELTYRCQAQCIHCYNPGATRNDDERNGRSDIEELSLNDYYRIIDDLCDNGLASATITGGDPFMHPYTWQILDYLYKKDVAVSVYTNGLGLIGKEERLASYYPYKVQCSLYSGDPEVHDKITRTKGSWQRTVRVMDSLHELGVPIDVACPLMQTNLKTYFGVKPYVRKYGSSLAFDVMLTDSIEGDKCVSKHLRLTPEQLSVVLLDEDVIQHINIDKVHDDSPVDRKFLNAPPCGAASSSFCINPNGDITPCCSFHKILGNVKQNNIRQIIEKNDFLWKWKYTTEKDFNDCYSHEYCYYCYFCPGNNYNDNGEHLNGGENNCYLAKIRYNTVMRLRNGEDILQGMSIENYINTLEIKDDIIQHEYIQ